MPKKLETSKKSGLKHRFSFYGPNDSQTIDRLQGLAIQPFIFALTNCLPDMDDQIGDDPYHRGPHYQRDRKAAGGLIQALGRSGYSQKGTPYWVNPAQGEPTIEQIDDLRLAAVKCLPVLRDRYNVLVNDPQKLPAFETRLQAFDQAIEEFSELVGTHEASRIKGRHAFADASKSVVNGPGYMCALE